jgi:hypothetical protein
VRAPISTATSNKQFRPAWKSAIREHQSGALGCQLSAQRGGHRLLMVIFDLWVNAYSFAVYDAMKK